MKVLLIILMLATAIALIVTMTIILENIHRGPDGEGKSLDLPGDDSLCLDRDDESADSRSYLSDFEEDEEDSDEGYLSALGSRTIDRGSDESSVAVLSS